MIQINFAHWGRPIFRKGEVMESAARDDYGPVPKTLHWVTVLLVIIAWSLGMFGEELSEESA